MTEKILNEKVLDKNMRNEAVLNKKILTVTMNPCIDKTMTVSGFMYGGLNRVKDIRTDAGGKGINVSKVLYHFGADQIACGLIAGKQGQEIADYLDRVGIRHSFIQTEGEVRTNYKIVDSDTKVTTEINEPGFYVTEDVVECCVNHIMKLLPDTEVMILAGSIPSGVSENIYKRLIEAARPYDVKVILDADGNKLLLGLEAIPYAIKPNLFEFEQLLGTTLDSQDKIVEAARKYIEKGIGLVVISMGADGALFVDAQEAYRAIPFEIECKSTVGAGDSMVAAVAYGLQQGYDLETIARFATAAGSVTASKEGTEVCMLEEVVQKASCVQIIK